MSATNHITGSGSTLDLHRALTDEQLEEQIAYYRACQDRLREEPPDGKLYGNRYSIWGYSKLLSMAWTVKKERSQRA
jgi:hypothetical protein